jgi:signal transduction histidine kinase
MPSKKYSVFSSEAPNSQALQAWHRLPLALTTLVLAAPLLVVLWAILWFSLGIETQNRQQKEDSFVIRTSLLGTESLRTLLASADLVLLQLRHHWLNHPDEFHAVLQARHDTLQLGSPFEVFVVDAKGKVHQSVGITRVVHHLSDYAALWSRHQKDNQDQVLMGPVFFDRISQRWQLPLTRRLLSPSGAFIGIMVFLVPSDYFNRVLHATNLPEGSVFSIIDLSSGDLILRSLQVNGHSAVDVNGDGKPDTAQDFWFFLNLGIPAINSGIMVSELPPVMDRLPSAALTDLKNLPVSGTSRMASTVDRVERLYAWSKLERQPLVVTVGTPSSRVDSTVSIQKLRYLATGSAFSLLVLLLVAGFNVYNRSRSISRETLKASEQALHQLAFYQTDLIEDERKFIAREIHDDFGQRLSALRLGLAMLIIGMQNTCSADLQARATQLKDAIDALMLVTRHLAKKVRPPMLDIGFLPAVEALCDDFQSRQLFKLSLVNYASNTLQPDPLCAIAAYRILQESLTNAARHAHCKHVDISLEVHADWLHLRVVDDGVGFDPLANPDPSSRRTFGLLGMRERIAALHGNMRLRSQTGQGCKLLVLLPLNSAAVHVSSSSDKQ